jgi:hypothetical protein
MESAMTVATNPAQTVGCWDLRGIDLDNVFAADHLSDTAHSARYRTKAKFSPHFPGWELYRRVAGGMTLHDAVLEEWAVTTARMLSCALKDNGRDYISPKTRCKPLWIDQAGRDGLDFAIFGRYPEGLHERGDRFGVAHRTYQKIRDPVAASICVGLNTYKSQLHAEYWRVREDERRA